MIPQGLAGMRAGDSRGSASQGPLRCAAFVPSPEVAPVHDVAQASRHRLRARSRPRSQGSSRNPIALTSSSTNARSHPSPSGPVDSLWITPWRPQLGSCGRPWTTAVRHRSGRCIHPLSTRDPPRDHHPLHRDHTPHHGLYQGSAGLSPNSTALIKIKIFYLSPLLSSSLPPPLPDLIARSDRPI